MWTEPKRPQLNQAELLQLKWLLGTLLAALSAWTVPYMEINAWGWLALITVAAPVMLWRPALTARVPRWAHWLAFPVILALAAGDFVMWHEPLPALIRLTLMLLLYRMVTPRRRRDDLQVIVLGLFLVVVAGVLSVSIVFAPQILAFTGCALLFLLTITMSDAAGAGGRGTEWKQVSWLALARRVRAVTNWRVALLGGGLFAGLVAMSSAFFLLLPRFDFESGLFLNRLMSGKARTGFSETVHFGDVTDIQNDNSIAFTVDVSDPKQVPADLYWRMLVLDEYENGNFRMSDGLKNSLEIVKEKTTQYPGTGRQGGDAPVWKFYFEAGTSRFLPLPGNFYQIIFAEPQDLKGSNGLRVVELQRAPVSLLAYRVDRLEFSPIIAGTAAELAVAGAAVKAKLSADGERKLLAGWVKPFAGPGDDATGFARRVCAWLAQGHTYAMRFRLADDPAAATNDPIVRWLASSQPGHCEFFAGAFVLLAREAGYAARLVVGFKGGTWNPHSENLAVRNSDAHAWCEIFDNSKQAWLRVDPTSVANPLGEMTDALKGEAALRRISDDSFSARFDSLRVFWYRRIVNFDRSTQREIGSTVQLALEDYGRRLKAYLLEKREELLAWGHQPWDWRRLAAWAGGAMLVITGVRWWRVTRFARLRRRGANPIRRAAGRLLVRIAMHEAEADEKVRRQLERLRYGATGTWPDPASVFLKARQLLRQGAKSCR